MSAPRPPASAAPASEPTPLFEWVKVAATPLATVLITVIGGSFMTDWLKQRETAETNARMYAQLLTQREQSDALIRKDMFNVVLQNFLTRPPREDWNEKVLQLELLANNFNQSLDLAPLFKDMSRRMPVALKGRPDELRALQKRLDLTASNLVYKQSYALARRGRIWSAHVSVADVDKSIGKGLIDEKVTLSRLLPQAVAEGLPDDRIRFTVEVVDVNLAAREIEARLRIDFDRDSAHDVDRHFTVGRYDFPMLDNTQVAHGLRVSVVLTEFAVAELDDPADRASNSFFRMYLVVFPAGSASFKERQDYDDILLEMLRAQVQKVPPAPGDGDAPR
jgi:hypothetical protein